MLNNRLFEGKYRILKILGQGGTAKVYLAENIKLGSLWTIKQINKKHACEVNLLTEPYILKNLNHPSLPRVFDILEDDDSYYVILDFIHGTSLDKKLEKEGNFDEKTVIEWARQICDVLIYLHEFKPNPIIYRDMKPSNIILTDDKNIKLIDFGTAREYKEEANGDTVYIGTKGYAAPEQYGDGQTSAASDIYSLGVTLYELVTGKGPNQFIYEDNCDTGLSGEFKSILKKCMNRQPEERYQSVRELLKDINSLNECNNKNGNIEENITVPVCGSPLANFKKLVLTVWDNAEFGCELAYICAKLTDLNVMLVDLNLLAPKSDLYLNIKKVPKNVMSEGLFSDSGLNIAMDSIEKNFLTQEILKEASVKRRDVKNLFVLTGNYKLENYEYYKDNSLVKLIEDCYRGFDVTVLLVNRSIYDSYTVISLLKSDYNLIPVRAEVSEIREFNSYLKFLKDTQNLPMDKTKFVAFEYRGGSSLTNSTLKEITGNNYLGSIGYSRRRIKYRNLRIPYVRRMEREIIRDYINLMRRFNIVTKMSATKKINMLFTELWRKQKAQKFSGKGGEAHACNKDTSQTVFK